MLRRIHQRSEARGEQIVALVLATDMKRILDAVRLREMGEWQTLFGEIIGNGSANTSSHGG